MMAHGFTLPDTLTCSPLARWEFSPATRDRAAAVLAGGPEAILAHLLTDQESESCLLTAKTVVDAFLAQAPPAPDEIVATTREQLVRQLAPLTTLEPELREAVLRQRAPISLAGGCWLDVVSQPATQPSVIVNDLFRQHYRLKGEGSTQRSAYHRRKRTLEENGVELPELTASDFGRRAHTRPLTALHTVFYVALSRLPASYLPEVIGVHYAFHALGVDDLLTGDDPVLDPDEPRAVLDRYLLLCGDAERRRLHAAVALTTRLETEHVALLTELADWFAGLSRDAKVAAIIARHAPYAGRQHGRVRVGGEPLTETFADPEFDLTAFLIRLRRSRQLKPLPSGGCRLLNAIRFGGPMFGIFDEREAATLREWVAAVQAGSPEPTELPVNRVGDEAARHWSDAIAGCRPAGVAYADPAHHDERELFYRLVNIEHFPNTLAQARHRAETVLADSELLFAHGGDGVYSDVSWFDYTPEALLARVDDIYWGKLVGPYQPLAEIPDRDEVIFGQTLLALAALVDGAWAYRIGNLGRYQRRSDGLLLGVYADEMGLGDVRKNHITLIRQVLDNLELPLPHIRDAAFRDQAELPDTTYGYALHQLCLSLSPDTLYQEILGFNLGIELSGLGRQRMHEAQKLRAHGLDTTYEDVHLSIDNFSTGHARQAADAIVVYLDDVARVSGPGSVQAEWRRVWRGYASFAFFAEYELVKRLTENAGDDVELMI
ncbi:MAG: iron-containing redox enzyme family protein [Micromonosporaceae bacterium]